MKFIDPRIDFAFKKIFGSEDTKDILISFLESLLGLEGEKRIREVTLLDPYLLPRIKGLKTTILSRSKTTEKQAFCSQIRLQAVWPAAMISGAEGGSVSAPLEPPEGGTTNFFDLLILDVRCTDHRDISYIVEIQIANVRGFLKRIQSNASKMYVNQIASGTDYPKLNQVIAITITDFTLFDTKEIPHWLSCHITVEKETRKNYLSDIVYYFIELPKFDKEADGLETVLDKWVWFLKKAGELYEIPDNFKDDPFSHAFEKALAINMDKEEFELYEKAGMAMTDAKGAIMLAVEEERKKERKKTARNLIAMGMSTDQISQATGLCDEEVDMLR